MSEKRSFKQNFIRSAVISSAIGITAYSIISSVPWGILGLEFGGGLKPDAAVEEAARAAAVTETIVIDGKTWMKRNLNVWTRNSWCYENSSDSCNKYGRLYTWHAAKKACASLGDGWRLPTEYDWDALINAAGGSEIAGAKLKSQTDWSPMSIGTDEFVFSTLHGGYMRSSDHRFAHAGNWGMWWSATERGGSAYRKDIGYKNDIESYLSDKTEACSVRCVKD